MYCTLENHFLESGFTFQTHLEGFSHLEAESSLFDVVFTVKIRRKGLPENVGWAV